MNVSHKADLPITMILECWKIPMVQSSCSPVQERGKFCKDHIYSFLLLAVTEIHCFQTCSLTVQIFLKPNVCFTSCHHFRSKFCFGYLCDWSRSPRPFTTLGQDVRLGPRVPCWVVCAKRAGDDSPWDACPLALLCKQAMSRLLTSLWRPSRTEASQRRLRWRCFPSHESGSSRNRIEGTARAR